MKINGFDALSLGALAALGALALYLYPDLSERVPVHWNVTGEADAYMPKRAGTALLVAIPALTYLLLKCVPYISPAGFRMDQFRRVVDILTFAVTVTLAGVSAAALIAASGRNVPVATVATLLVGALMVVLGNYLGKVRKNFFIGIRTPWTLASDEVWARTHRVGGWLFLLAGLAVLLAAPLPVRLPIVLISTVVAASLICVVYSYVVYRKLHGSGGDASDR